MCIKNAVKKNTVSLRKRKKEKLIMYKPFCNIIRYDFCADIN